MNGGWDRPLVGLMLLTFATWGSAQDPSGAVVLDQLGQPTHAMLVPAGDVIVEPAAAVVGTNNASLATVLDGPNHNDIRFELGVKFLVPVYDDNTFRNLLPGATRDFFPGLDFSSTIRPDLNIAPILQAEWDFTRNFGVRVSGYSFTATGRKDMQSSSATGTFNLDSSAELTMFVADLPEIVYRTRFEDCECLCRDRPYIKDTYLGATSLAFSLGMRYAALKQDFNANLTADNNVTANTRTSLDYAGFGLTGAFDWGLPLVDHFVLYCNQRASVLFGNLEKDAVYTLNPQTTLADTVNNHLNESRTAVVPVGNFECGFVWHNKPVTSPETGTLAWIKVAFVAEAWGGMGLLSASDSGFDAGNLFLYGLLVQAGMSR